MAAKFACWLLGHREYTVWTAGAGDVWGQGCYRCPWEEPIKKGN